MKLKHIFTALLVSLTLLNGTIARAAETQEIPDLVYFDGSAWNRIDRISPEWAMAFKSFLVRGIYEGAYTANPKMFTERFNNDTSYREIVKALDDYYQDENNLRTPVSYAIMIVLKAPQPLAIHPAQGSVLVSKGSGS